jgi:predicted glycogen debranching enzyme
LGRVIQNSIDSREVLLTDGVGGYSLFLENGLINRKYHGLFITSKKPPVDRYHTISIIKESMEIENNEICILDPLNMKSEYQNYSKLGYHFFEIYKEEFTFVKKIDYDIKDEILFIKYEIDLKGKAGKLKLEPFYNFRQHDITKSTSNSEYIIDFSKDFKIMKDEIEIKISTLNEYDFNRFENSIDTNYLWEIETGYSSLENIVSFGEFIFNINNKLIITLQISQNKDLSINNPFKDHEKEFHNIQIEDNFVKQLIYSSKDFIIKRGERDYSIIAGYPWFTDWGRDSMISLRGLTISTDRFEVTKSIVLTYLKNMKDGIIPNNFPEDNSSPMYNTVDASLWAFEAINDYFDKTNDKSFLKDILPQLRDILRNYINGTINNIKLDDNYLIWNGDSSTQLTWMDVKVNGWVVIPRHGYAIDINGLFYNALMLYNKFLTNLGIVKDFYIEELSKKVKIAINNNFYNQEKQAFYDVINENGNDSSIRPNQLFLTGLTFSPLDDTLSKILVDNVQKDLYTYKGIRTLSPNDDKFHYKYSGALIFRDSAYHRGTIWPFLLGLFYDSHYRVYKDKNFIIDNLRKQANDINRSMLYNLNEIIDSTEPYKGRGCVAQAWSLGEFIRIYKKFV